MSNQFKGRKLLVVGGTSGMGLQTARMVLAEGGSAVIVGCRPEKTEEARKDLAALGQVVAVTADLASDEGLSSLLKTMASSIRISTCWSMRPACSSQAVSGASGGGL